MNGVPVVRSNKQLKIVRQELRETIPVRAELPKQEEDKVCWTKECILSGIQKKSI